MARNCEQHDQTHDDIRAEQFLSAKEKLRQKRSTEKLAKLRVRETQRLLSASPKSPVERKGRGECTGSRWPWYARTQQQKIRNTIVIK